jgi:hypothetical protein
MGKHERAHVTTLREKLNEVIDVMPTGQVVVSNVIQIMGREGSLLMVVFLTLPFMVPVSLPGVSTVLGAVILLIGLCVMRGRPLWLPHTLSRRSLNAGSLQDALKKSIVWVNRLERLSHQRLTWLSEGQVMARINGFMLMTGAVLLMAPFGFVPLSNTLPGLALLFLAIGMLQKDGYCILLGYLFTVVTIVYFATLFGVGFIAAKTGLEKIIQWLL